MTTIKALDLFAGTGWGVACQRLGIDEYGVEIMPEARAIRAANGMRTIYADVWSGLDEPSVLETQIADHDLLIASPPCQAFSMAGKGAGRKALDDVLEAIDERLYLDPVALREFASKHGDDRIALVLTPLAYVAQNPPLYVVLEQVPPVLPVWERYAEVMRGWGYSVWTGYLQAEMYGVPQTRKRAILIARADGKVAEPPAPTHSRYYSRDPKRLDEGVLPWVSMAQALGWGMTERPMITAGNAIGRAEGVGGSGAKAAINREKDRGAWTDGEIVVRTSMGTPKVDGRNGTHELDPFERPMHTVTTKVGETRVIERGAENGYIYLGDESQHLVRMLVRDDQKGVAKVRVEESETLPVGAEVTVPLRKLVAAQGPRYLVGNQVPRGNARDEYHARMTDAPAQTLTSNVMHAQWSEDGKRTTGKYAGVGVRMRSNYSAGGGKGQTAEERGRTMRDADEPSVAMTGKPGHWVPADSDRPAPTVTGGGAATGGAEVFGRRGREIVERMAEERREVHLDPDLPSPTVAGDPRIPERGWREPHQKQMERASRVTVEEAAALQSYPPGFVWDAEFDDPKTGKRKPITKTNKFLQVGNAVPPLLAEAILRAVVS